MSKTINQRMMARLEGDFVVFIIGMRINRFWKLHKWLPVAMAMPRMLKELEGKPESGFLGAMNGLTHIVQYWRSFEHLEAYARDKDGKHFPAWQKFNQRMRRNGDVGIWHETYQVKEGAYENIYNNMPPHGLGKIGKLMPVSGKYASMAGRK